MGSDSDLPVMRKAAEVLKTLDVPYAMTIASAHRTPDRVIELVEGYEREGVKVIIAGAGAAAHLAGAIAGRTLLPVIGVPLASGALSGLDSLLSTVQMPPGVPVATVGVDGAANAGILAVEILAVADDELRARLAAYRAERAETVLARAAEIEAEIA
jgi:phosphoribosylaminoimidazole carboxylase PurE protein